ncbi:hypothetical protein [Lactiplantibacillus plantarum]|uniref:hypothetical protein n=1 Tax=Lactiplantibacillus plantarum TaxID=1590 RepID=UPI0021A7251B|nr:hypothetical protein [Lactiplantibacillus plantarum]MCT3234721.1 hypothetical protein [Lactiplantibacillus plantarum]
MAKSVKFDGKKIGTGTQYTLIDSGQNVEKMAEAYKKLIKTTEETEDSITGVVELTPKLAKVVAETTCDLLELNASQKKRVMSMEFSVSDEYDFFNDCLKQFLGVELPSVGNSSDQEEEEDPKLPKPE